MAVIRNSQSPLIHSELTKIGDTDGVVFWDRTFPPPVEPLSIDGEHTVEMGNRHDLLAFRRLQSSQLGWVIMERNNAIVSEEIDMRLWPNDFVPGYRIKIPTQSSISNRGIAP